MFKYAELLVIILMLYLFVNILRYTILKCGITDRLGGTWLFGLSNSWLGTSDKSKENGARKED